MLKLETLPVLAKSPLNVPFPFQGPLNFKFLPVTHFEYIRIIYVGVFFCLFFFIHILILWSIFITCQFKIGFNVLSKLKPQVTLC